MPHKVERWRCDFCRRKTYADKSKILEHEITCFDNPKRRACRTCKHEDFSELGSRQCLHKGDFLETTEAKNLIGEPFDNDPNIRWNCEGWEPYET